MADTTDLKQRFEITVPSPSVRINMGEPLKEKGEPTFGYIGMSLQSDVDFYVDVNKNAFYQASHVLHQAGGNWLQYSDGPMYLTTVASQHLASSDQLSLFAGAGYGNSTGLDHGKRVRAHKYNNLEKHYRTDEIQNGLFEFFYGRRARNPKVTHGYDAGGFDSQSAGRSKALETEKELTGFRAMVDKSQKELGFVASDPAWIEAISEMSAAGRSSAALAPAAGGDPKALEYGFSSYFKRFDPYNKTDPDSLTHSNPHAARTLKLVALARNALARGRRIVDATRKVGAMITDNAFSARALKLAEAMDGFGSAWRAMNNVIDRHPFQRVRWVDEYNSGFNARATAAKEQGTKQASISGSAEPFALANGDTMKVVAPTKGAAPQTTRAVVATKAEIVGSGPVQRGWAGTATFSYEAGPDKDITFNASNTASEGDLLTHLNSTLSEPAEISGSCLTLRSAHEGRLSRVRVTADAATLGNLGLTGNLSTSVNGAVVDAPSSPRFPINAGSLQVTAMGMTAPAAVDFSATPAADMAALETILNAAWAASAPPGAGSSVAANAAGKLSLSVQSPGSTSAPSGILPFGGGGAPSLLLVVTADSRATFEQLGLAPASGPLTVDSGAPTPGNNVDDVSAVTARDVAALFSGLTGVTVEVEDGALKLTSNTKSDGSHVAGTSGMASSLGLAQSDTVTSGYKGAREDFAVINHELQKLPEDARNLTRPITEHLEDIMSVLSNLEATVEALIETVTPDGFLGGPPAALGLFGKEGISIGTPDRVIGAAGLGFVFMADGGTGQRDRNKFAGLAGAIEKPVTAVLEWVPPFMRSKEPAGDPDANLGFRVCSDTTVNLTATSTAELLALGRGNVAGKPRGIGVARVAGSRSAEVAGYEKVSIGARAKKGSKAVKDGGRVELVADTIAIGAGHDGTRTVMGIKNLDKGWKLKGIDGQDHEGDLAGRQMTPDAYPLTRNVTVESSEATVLRVGSCAIRVTKDEGLYFGWDIDKEYEKSTKKVLQDEVDRITGIQTAKTKMFTELKARIAAEKALGVLGEFQARRLALREARADLWENTELPQVAADLAAAQAALAAVPALEDALVPVLEIKREGIVLGYRKGKDGDVKDGPHLKITDKGFSLETGDVGKEVSIATDKAGKKLIVKAETDWSTAKNVGVKPTGELSLEPSKELKLKGSNVTVRGSGSIRIG